MRKWLLALFVILLILIIAALAVLYYLTFKWNSETTTVGPQGLRGDQGEIGFVGPRGTQGYAQIGPQGISGTNASFSTTVQQSTFSFSSVDGATFQLSPDSKAFTTVTQVNEQIVTISAQKITCYIVAIGSKTFTLRVALPNEIATAANAIVTMNGYAQVASTLFSVLLTSATRADAHTLALVFTSGSAIWAGGGAFPQCDVYFTVTYQST